jgi:hypothetical protein
MWYFEVMWTGNKGVNKTEAPKKCLEEKTALEWFILLGIIISLRRLSGIIIF